MGVTIDGTPISEFAKIGLSLKKRLNEQAEKLTISDFGLEPGEKMMIITDLSEEILDGRSCGVESVVVLGCFIVVTTPEQLASLKFADYDLHSVFTPENAQRIK